MRKDVDVIIVGAGLAGLCCAKKLQEKGISFKLLEASDGVGGRVRTDKLDGFLLDRGFQVLLTAYPEARTVLDYQKLQLQTFYPGALIFFDSKFHRVANPFQRLIDGFMTAFSPVGSFMDKLRIALLHYSLESQTVTKIFQKTETTTLELLKGLSFSDDMIEKFFRPFFGGIFLERELRTSSKMFEFIFKMFSVGETAIPAGGMGAIPEQIASTLTEGAILLNTRAEMIDKGSVISETGEKFTGRAVVIATEAPQLSRLVDKFAVSGSKKVTCLYFATPTPPTPEPILMLDGEGEGPVNNLSVLDSVAPSYAPSGSSLISATVIDDRGASDAELEEAVRKQMARWFGEVVKSWKHLRTYRIAHAQPEQQPPALAEAEQAVKIEENLYVCGDHRDNASIYGAMVSGRRAAEAIIRDFQV